MEFKDFLGWLAFSIDKAMLGALTILLSIIVGTLHYFDRQKCGMATYDYDDAWYTWLWIVSLIIILVYVGVTAVLLRAERVMGLVQLGATAVFSIAFGLALWAAIVPRCGQLVSMNTKEQKHSSPIDEYGAGVAILLVLVGFLESIHILATRFGSHDDASRKMDVTVGHIAPTAISLILSIVGAICILVSGYDRSWHYDADSKPKIADGTEIASAAFDSDYKTPCESGNETDPGTIIIAPYDMQDTAWMWLSVLIIVTAVLAAGLHVKLLMGKGITEAGNNIMRGVIAVCEFASLLLVSIILASVATATVNPECSYVHYKILHQNPGTGGIACLAVAYFMFIMAQNNAYYSGLKVNEIGSTLRGLRDHLLA